MGIDKKLRSSIVIISVIGLIDSLYLSWLKFTHREAFCGGSGDCQTVASSPYSEIAGIPIAVLGLGAYAVILGLIYIEQKSDFWREFSPLLVFGISLVGIIYSIYLTYIEIAVIYAICPYCVVSAIAMLLIFIVSIARLVINAPSKD